MRLKDQCLRSGGNVTFILTRLARNGGSVIGTAKALGVQRMPLCLRMKRHGLRKDSFLDIE